MYVCIHVCTYTCLHYYLDVYRIYTYTGNIVYYLVDGIYYIVYTMYYIPYITTKTDPATLKCLKVSSP